MLDSPRLHARLVSTIRSPFACSSMSSQTQPQKVQVAFLTIVKLISFPHLVSRCRRPDRAARGTFTQAHALDNCLGRAAA